MINYKIDTLSKFTYWTEEVEEYAKIDVFINNENIYSIDSNIKNGIYYYVEIFNEWDNKNVFITGENNKLKFQIDGRKLLLSDDEKDLLNKYFVQYNNEYRTDLCDIMDKHKSDKGSKTGGSYGHNYTRFYNDIFKKFKYDEINLFELGLGTSDKNVIFNMGEDAIEGASILGWRDYFKNGFIYGADIDTKCLFNSNNIKTFFCDQTNPIIINQMWDNKYLDFKFDIIIEDGLHQFDANLTFFENSYHKLKKHGIFIIEDIFCNEIINWLYKIKEYETKFPQFEFKIINILCDHNQFDNNLIKIKYKNNE